MKDKKSIAKIDGYYKKSSFFPLYVACSHFKSALEKELAPHELSVIEALIILALFFEEGGVITPKQLHKAMKVTKSNLSHCITSLEKKGFIRRGLDPEDARSYPLSLLSKGKTIAPRLIKTFDNFEHAVDSVLPSALIKGMHAFAEAAQKVALYGND